MKTRRTQQKVSWSGQIQTRARMSTLASSRSMRVRHVGSSYSRRVNVLLTEMLITYQTRPEGLGAIWAYLAAQCSCIHPFLLLCFTLLPHRNCIQNRSYYWHRHILHPIDHPRICRIRRCIPDALGGGIFALILWAFYLA